MTVSVSPTYPIAGEEVTFSQTVTVDGVSVTIAAPHVLLTSVPPDSELEAGLLVDDAGEPSQSFTPDVPGEYVYRCEAFYDFNAPAAFEGDGAGDTYAIAMSEETGTLHVGVAMDLPIRTLTGHGLTVRVEVVNATVRAAELVDWTTDVAYAATQNSTVQTKLAALVGVASTSFGPDLIANVADAVVEYADHRTQAGVHSASGDTVWTYVRSRPYDKTAAIEQLNALRNTLEAHMTRGSEQGPSVTWHAADDNKNVFIVAPAASLAEATVLWADYRRVYEAHRVQTSNPAAHLVSDSTNTLPAVDVLTDLVSTILAFFADETPTVATGLSDGAVELQSLYGFEAT